MRYIIIICFLVTIYDLIGQSKLTTPNIEPVIDSNFVFESPRPLIKSEPEFKSLKNIWAMELFFSNSGFGFGINYSYNFKKNWNVFAHLFISTAKNTDEYEYYNDSTNSFFVPGKVNWVFQIPITIGVQKIILENLLTEKVRPFVEAGFGSSFVTALPYDKSFFNSFNYMTNYAKLATFLGAGVYIGAEGTNLFSINARYYYIPFGKPGIESMKNFPMTNLGGLFLSINVGRRF